MLAEAGRQAELQALESAQRALRRFSCNLILKGAKIKRKTITISWQEGCSGPQMTLGVFATISHDVRLTLNH